MENKNRQARDQAQCREMIGNVYNFLKQEYEFLVNHNHDNCDLSHLSDITQRTAEATGVSSRTVARILKLEKSLLVPKKKGKGNVSKEDTEDCDDSAESDDSDDLPILIQSKNADCDDNTSTPSLTCEPKFKVPVISQHVSLLNHSIKSKNSIKEGYNDDFFDDEPPSFYIERKHYASSLSSSDINLPTTSSIKTENVMDGYLQEPSSLNDVNEYTVSPSISPSEKCLNLPTTCIKTENVIDKYLQDPSSLHDENKYTSSLIFSPLEKCVNRPTTMYIKTENVMDEYLQKPSSLNDENEYTLSPRISPFKKCVSRPTTMYIKTENVMDEYLLKPSSSLNDEYEYTSSPLKKRMKTEKTRDIEDNVYNF